MASEKGRESGGKRKEAGNAERFPPSLLMSQKEISHTVLVWGFYSQSPFTNYQKPQIQTLLQGESRKKTKKRTKSERGKRAAGRVLETLTVRRGNFAGCEIFAAYKISKFTTVLLCPCIFCSSFLLVSDLHC